MRRSRSQLSNLTPGNSFGSQPGNPGGHHADDIQRRINGLNIPAQPAFQGHGAHGYPEPNYPHPYHGHPYPGHPPHPYSNAAPASIYPPQYADVPASGGYQELEQMRASMDQLAANLQDMQARSAGSSTHSNHGSSSASDLSGQVSQLRDVVTLLAKEQPNREDWASLRSMLEQANDMIATTVKNTGSSQSTEAYAKVVETSHTNLSRQIVELQQSLAANTGSPDVYAQTLEASHDDLRQQLAQLQQATSAQNDQTIENVQSISDQQTAILEEIGHLKGSLEAAGTGNQGSATDTSAIETRLEEITRAIVALSNSGVGPEQLERIEARISDLSRNVANQADVAVEPVDSSSDNTILEELNRRLEAFDVAAQSLNSDLSAQLENVQEKLENLSIVAASGNIPADEAGINPLIARLDALVEQGQQANPAPQNDVALAAISEQLSGLAAQMEHSRQTPMALADTDVAGILGEIDQKLYNVSTAISEAGPASGNEDVLQRLVRIEEQVASSRDITLEFASQVADDAVQKALQTIPEHLSHGAHTAGGSLDVQALADEIKRLQEASEQNGSNTLQTFDAVRDSLEKMVDRLHRIENSVQSAQYEAPYSSQLVNENMHTEASTPSAMPAISQEPIEPQPQRNPTPAAATPDRQTGNDMVAEYRAVIAQEGVPTSEENMDDAIGVQALVAEAARAEEERARKKAAAQPNPDTLFANEENEREFKSDPGAAMFMDEDMNAVPSINPAPSINPEDIAEIPDTPVALADEVPLEPGGMGPDLAALVRKANEQRKSVAQAGGESSNNEFIAAARRAAQAAAEEASAVEDEIREQSKKKSGGFLPGLFKKRNKAVMMAAGAALLAALAIPLISTLVSDPHNPELAQLENPVTGSIVDRSKNTAPLQENESLLTVEDPGVEQGSQTAGNDDLAPVVEVALETPEAGQEHNSAQDAILSNQISQPAASFGYEVSIQNPALQEAVAQGDPAAMFEVARRYMEGQGVTRDVTQAAIWLERAAERNHAPAQYLIGNLNEKGVGVERNRAIAESWYTKAADQGHVVAMHNLAVLHATPNGETGQPDMTKAFKWFRKAAEFGVRDSQVNLGIFYTKGVGTPVSLSEAYRWFTLAAKAGDKDAEAKRDVIANALRPDQLEDAKELIDAWRPAEMIQSANNSTPAPAWTADLERTSISNNKQAVAKAQLMLAKLGYNTGPADGIMGKKTRQAIAQFQQKSGISVNGEVTIELLRALEAIAI